MIEAFPLARPTAETIRDDFQGGAPLDIRSTRDALLTLGNTAATRRALRAAMEADSRMLDPELPAYTLAPWGTFLGASQRAIGSLLTIISPDTTAETMIMAMGNLTFTLSRLADCTFQDGSTAAERDPDYWIRGTIETTAAILHDRDPESESATERSRSWLYRPRALGGER